MVVLIRGGKNRSGNNLIWKSERNKNVLSIESYLKTRKYVSQPAAGCTRLNRLRLSIAESLEYSVEYVDYNQESS